MYNINAQSLLAAYDINGNRLSRAYDIDGNQLIQTDPYLENRLLIFEDDFNGNSLNENNWTAEVGHPRGKSYECKYPANVIVENGYLKVSEKKETHGSYTWAGATIFSRGKKSWVNGRFEAKMKVAPVFNSAFWFMGTSFRGMYTDLDGNPNYPVQYTGVENIENWAACGEIDVCESWNYNDKSRPTCNLWSPSGNSISSASFPTTLDTVNEWHIYAMEKTSTYIAMFIDGTEFKRYTFSDYDSAIVAAYIDKPISILIGIAIGDESDINRGFTDVSAYCDWVRVYAPVGVSAQVLPESISIQNNLELNVGRRTYMNPVILPLSTTDRTVTWESDDSSIVRVEYGNYIYAESVGETDIYAITTNGLRSKCHVTVVQAI